MNIIVNSILNLIALLLGFFIGYNWHNKEKPKEIMISINKKLKSLKKPKSKFISPSQAEQAKNILTEE